MRSNALLLALLLALGATGGPATPTNADAKAQALLALHRAFVGWQLGDGTFSSMRVSGSVTDEHGKTTSTFVLLSRGLLSSNSFTDLTRAGVVERRGFTGNLFWESDYNGFTTPIYGDAAKFFASFDVLRNEGTTELPATFRASKTVDGKAADVVRVTLAGGDPIDLYVDPQTGAYIKATIDPDGAYETTYHIASYADLLPGKKMMSSYTVDDGKAVHTYTKFEPNVPVSNDDLHPPAPIASWTFGSGAPFPFTMTHTRMLVDATINGVKGRFILDTGADAIVIDDGFAARAGLDVLNTSDYGRMIYGAVKVRLRKIRTLTIGDSTLHDVVAFSQDFNKSEYGDIHSEGYNGLIGFDLFAGAIVKLNVYESTMAIVDPATDLSAEKGLQILVDLSEGIPAIPMVLDKTIPVNAMLDTGNPGIIFFGPDVVSKHHFPIVSGCGYIHTLAIGPIVYAGEPACEYGMAADDMLLGFDFLKHFDFIFDYPHGRIFIHPNKN
jgi:hypothetical protein